MRDSQSTSESICHCFAQETNGCPKFSIIKLPSLIQSGIPAKMSFVYKQDFNDSSVYTKPASLYVCEYIYVKDICRTRPQGDMRIVLNADSFVNIPWGVLTVLYGSITILLILPCIVVLAQEAARRNSSCFKLLAVMSFVSYLLSNLISPRSMPSVWC